MQIEYSLVTNATRKAYHGDPVCLRIVGAMEYITKGPTPMARNLLQRASALGDLISTRLIAEYLQNSQFAGDHVFTEKELSEIGVNFIELHEDRPQKVNQELIS